MSDVSNESDKISSLSWRYRYIPVALVVLAGIGCSVGLLYFARQLEWDRKQVDFEQVAQERALTLRRNLRENIQALGWIAGFYAGSHEVERGEFQSLVHTYLRNQPGIQALEWIPRVRQEERAFYEAAARQEGFTDFEITEKGPDGNMVRAAQRNEYFPVYFVEPYEGNASALGFDLASNPTRLEALAKARDTGEMVATARITLIQETGNRYGFLVFNPVYRKGAATDSIESRRENLQGFALGVFCVGDIVQYACLCFMEQGVDTYLYDISGVPDERFLGFNPSSRVSQKPSTPLTYKEALELTSLHYTDTLDVADRKWSIVYTATADFITQAKTWQPVALLACGLVFTGLLTVYVLFITAQTARQRRFAAQLLKAKQELEKEITGRKEVEKEIVSLSKFPDEDPNPVLRISRDGTILYANHASSPLLRVWQCQAGQSLSGRWYQYALDVLNSGQTSQTEVECNDRIFSLTFAPVVDCGYVNVYAHNVSEQSWAKSRLQQNVKHLDCFYSLSKLIEQPGISLEQIFQETANLIRNSYQRPELTCARITFNGVQYKTDNFTKSETSQFAQINVHRNKAGTIEVYYLGEKTESGKGPFLKEERDLLDAIAEHLGRIAERKRTADKLGLFRDLIDRSNDCIFVVEPKWGRFLDVNRKACETFEYTRKELLSMTIRDFEESIADDASWQQMIEELKLKGDITIQSRHRRKNATIFFTETSLKLVSQDKEDYIIAVARDITERKQAEQKQVELIEQVESANKELKDFAYVVSHDLKAPLRGIKTLADWITTDYADKLDGNGKEQIGLLSKRVDRMHNLIDGVLRYSRVGHAREKQIQVNLNEVVPEVIDMVSSPQDIEITVENQLPVVVCEETRIAQVFQNLLSNAVKYMDKPNGKIRIDCVEENGFWKFSVADNGPGIDEKNFKRIFQMFQTLSSKDEFESTGVGLAVVKKIVEMYGGEIWVESQSGNGSTFFFTLPKQDVRATNNAELEANTIS